MKFTIGTVSSSIDMTGTGILKTISIVGEAHKETKEAKSEACKNVMYYYYLASKL